ncbi:hypothetical protein SD70_08385 [Gordoniibacillus kamchatkensis]|uniref:DUF1802 family protein n=1 Tax=Gordoniibacillus kamchatkensis TaxID=1590651 RepID=A0ABR5AK82_9BACL|nr:DUF1802 family protein [Paenibacillus sp. VKM B-2647]KIL41258.1 hypothetical protein SD70_08385 [Paenibacillus sp. VKM B-2647]
MGKRPGPIALKEWAASVAALRDGLQTMMLRKGGIAEETRDFEVRADAFYLLPAYEHQKRELLKEEYRRLVDETLATWSPDAAAVTIDCCAEVAHDIELTELDSVERLYPYHIWTQRFAEDRLHWKRQRPLHLLLLRVYRLDRPFELKLEPHYFGCKSWVELAETPPEYVTMTPVLTDGEFAAQAGAIRSALRG